MGGGSGGLGRWGVGGLGRVSGRVGGVRLDVNKELEVFVKIQTKKLFIFFLGGGRGRGFFWGGQGGCERRFDVFVKIPKKNGGVGVGGSVGGSGGGVGLGGQGGCERRIEVFVKKKMGGGGRGVGGRVGGQGGCERRIEVFGENSKKKLGGRGVGRGSGGGVGMDVNEELKFL